LLYYNIFILLLYYNIPFAMKLLLVLLGVLFVGCMAQMSPDEMAKMQMPDLTHDYCAPHNKTCITCTSVKGCNYCQKASGPSFCTSITNSKEALCEVPGCSADTFITSLATCGGGCNSGYKCDECSNIAGCGFCQHKGDGDSGCMEASDYVYAPERCRDTGSVWGMGYGNCSNICEKRYTRNACMEPTRACIWDGPKEICSTSPTGIAKEIPVPEVPQKPADHKIEPPKPSFSADSESSHGNTALIFVVIVGAAVGVMLYKKNSTI